MKLLLYCTKGKPYLHKAGLERWCWNEGAYELFNCIGEFFTFDKLHRYKDGNNDVQISQQLNGKIVAQCDCNRIDGVCCSLSLENFGEFLWEYCLFAWQLYDYLDGKLGYNIHLSNVEVFDVPKELIDFGVKKAPQNMMKVFDDKGNEYILISVRPEHLKNILNGKKIIEVRKRILKSMRCLINEKK